LLVGLQEVEDELQVEEVVGSESLLVVVLWHLVVNLVKPVVRNVDDEVWVALRNN
jgi:hypothetical protein